MKQITNSNYQSNNKLIGQIGETIACNFLSNEGHTIIERNFWRKYGELDIVSKKGQVMHFVEVKAVSYETKQILLRAVTHETWRPEEKVNEHKLQRIYRTVDSWLNSNNYSGEWQIDVVTVRIVPRETFAVVKLIENVVI